MRLNGDALQDLVLLDKGGNTPRVFVTQPAATFVVNAEGNTSDANPGDGICADAAGNCTFGAALHEANTRAGADTIHFNIPGAGIHTLQNGRSVDDTVTIDGTTQPQGSIEIAGNGVFPLAFFTNNSVLRGVATYGSSYAILLLGNGNIVEGNHIGFRADGTVPTGYGNFGAGLAFRGGPNQAFFGSNNLIGGTTAPARNVVSNCAPAFELFGAGLGNIIRGNYIGTTPDGTAALPNRGSVIRADDNTDLTLGGTTAGAGNLISGNTSATSIVIGLAAAIVQGNLIGTDASGSLPLANSGLAIEVSNNLPVTIGGTTPAARNVISANALGLRIGHDSGDGSLIQGNYLGTNAAGTGALPNLDAGIQLNGTRAVTIGGVTPGAGNLISGNNGDGIALRGGVNGTPARGVSIRGNLIGTDADGVLAVPNQGDGIEVAAGSNCVLGGTSADARNVISGNRQNGLRLSSGPGSLNRIEGNFIGVNRFGSGALGNGQHGVFFAGPTDDTIGGMSTGAGNTIAHNAGAGIASNDAGFGIAGAIFSNSIFSNAGLGVDRGQNGVTPFQVTNFGQYPVLTSITSSSAQTVITGKLRTWTEGGLTPHTIQFFSNSNLDPSGHGEGQVFIGQTTINAGSNTEATFSVALTPPVPPGRFISAIAVGPAQAANPNGLYSSEFSFSVRTAGEATPENTPLRIHFVTPMVGGNTGSTTINIIGEGIRPGVSVVLRRAGFADIVGQVVDVSADGSLATVRFNLQGQQLGLWDLVVTNSGGASVSAAGAYTIEVGRPLQLGVGLLGHGAIRRNRPSRYTLAVLNNGNTDEYGVPAFITGIPASAQVTIVSALTPVPLLPGLPPGFDPNAVPPVTQTDEGQVVALVFPVLPARSIRTFEILVEVANDQEAFTIQAFVTAPLLRETSGAAARPGLLGAARSPGAPDAMEAPADLGDDAGNCLNSVFQNVFGCLSGFVPGPPCARAILSGLGIVNNLVTIVVSTPDGTGGRVMSFSQLLGAAISTAGAAGECLGDVIPGSQVLDLIGCGLGAVAIVNDCAPLVTRLGIAIVTSLDPNDKLGPIGSGPERYLTGLEPLPYTILFENKPEATAAAQDVIITDQLDRSRFNLDTFELGRISFGNGRVAIPPPGLQQWNTDVDLRPANNLIVRVIAALDRTTALVTWRFISLDPATMQPTEDPLAGFLPPNHNPPEGDGAVTFSISSLPNQPLGTEITNQARIVFDTNPPIDTPVWLNTIDNAKPASAVTALAPTQSSRRFPVSWSGSDLGAGVATYTIYVSENGGPYTIWLANTEATSALYDGRPTTNYTFYSVARDGAGNVEDTPSSADASTTTPAVPPVQLTGLASQKYHGMSAGFFVVDLPLSGNPGIECRSGGEDGDHTLVFTFTNPLTRVDGVTVTGTGAFDRGEIGTNPNQYLVHLTGVADAQYLNVTLNGAGDAAGNFSANVHGTVGFLLGDTNGDGAVGSSDIAQTKSHAGAPLSTTNFRADVNVNGQINASDIGLVKTRSGAMVP